MKIKMSNLLRAKMDAAKKTDKFWMESAKLDFALSIEEQRKRINRSYADVASAIKTSPAYISKVFRGDANLTIESMVKLSRSLGCNLVFRLEEIVESAVTSRFQIQSTKAVNNKVFFAEFIAKQGGVLEGKFNIPEDIPSTNDDFYQNAA